MALKDLLQWFKVLGTAAAMPKVLDSSLKGAEALEQLGARDRQREKVETPGLGAIRFIPPSAFQTVESKTHVTCVC